MRRLTSVLLATACLVPLGCGGDDGPDADAERADAEAAVAAFEAAVADDGFRPTDDDGEDDDGFEFTSEECQDLDDLLSDDDRELAGETAKEESDEYERSEGATSQETVQGSVTFADADALQDDLEAFDDERTAPCIEEGIRNAFAAQDSDVELELRDVEVTIDRPDLGDDALQLLASAVIAAPGIELPISIEFLAVRSGRRGASVIATALGADESVDLEELVGILLDPPEAT